MRKKCFKSSKGKQYFTKLNLSASIFIATLSIVSEFISFIFIKTIINAGTKNNRKLFVYNVN
ncbi:hypothetical protein FLGSB24_36790 [Flavobacterium sp. GSB-24]|nr:hypothetical protein FLGSB24_36790 [Flavobacterium sp. GSB-24]